MSSEGSKIFEDVVIISIGQDDFMFYENIDESLVKAVKKVKEVVMAIALVDVTRKRTQHRFNLDTLEWEAVGGRATQNLSRKSIEKTEENLRLSGTSKFKITIPILPPILSFETHFDVFISKFFNSFKSFKNIFLKRSDKKNDLEQ